MDMAMVFKALAFPNRRRLLDRLHANNGQTLSELCKDLDMSALGYSFSVLVVFVLVLYRVYPRVRQLISARVALLGLNTSVSETHQLLEEFARTSMRSGPRRFTGIQREIALEDISYSYPRAQKPALSGVCARFSKGDTIAIVGRSGAGKSTLIQIICRLIDPTAGTVRVDGIPLPELDLEQYRVRLAIVSQDIYLFSATVRHNIAYGRLDASDEEIVEAARRAHAGVGSRAARLQPVGIDGAFRETARTHRVLHQPFHCARPRHLLRHRGSPGASGTLASRESHYADGVCARQVHQARDGNGRSLEGPLRGAEGAYRPSPVARNPYCCLDGVAG